jgi:hypothetical protein
MHAIGLLSYTLVPRDSNSRREMFVKIEISMSFSLSLIRMKDYPPMSKNLMSKMQLGGLSFGCKPP